MKSFLILLFIIPIMGFAQTETSTPVFEVVNITPKKGQEKAFEEAVKEHNTQFHGEGSHVAFLTFLINGANAGTYNWTMRMPDFAAFETRPEGSLHDQDWEKVAAHIESVNFVEHWTGNSEMAQTGTADANKSMVWIYDIKPGQMSRWKELFGKVLKVYKEKLPNRNIGVYMNQFGDTRDGRDVSVLFNFQEWSYLDEDEKFGEKFNEVHGPGSWHTFLNAMAEVTDGRSDYLRLLID